MAHTFIDTSALVKYYHPEDGTQVVTRLLEEPGTRHYISRLSLVETVSAFAVKCRLRQIDDQGFDDLRRRFHHDIGQGRFRVMPITTVKISRSHTADRKVCSGRAAHAGRHTACRGVSVVPSGDDRPV